jgi:hypothetical protein
MPHVGRFAENAVSIFETAESVMEGNPDPMDLTIIVEAEGAIRMVFDFDWSLASPQSWQGTEMVYRVRRQGNAVRVEGRAGSRTCLFESRKLGGAASGSSCGHGSCSPASQPDSVLRPALPPTYELVARCLPSTIS